VASRVLNASSASASSAFAKCWVHSTNKTSALFRTVRSRAYSTKSGSEGSNGSHGTGSPFGLPLYRESLFGVFRSSSLTILYTGRLINAWTETPTKWYPLPLAVGALLLVAMQYRKKSQRARKMVDVDEDGMEVIKLKGPWQVCIALLTALPFPFHLNNPPVLQVHVIGALPLRNMSRLWGYINSLELPIWFRPYGLSIYAYAFGCNLDEIEPADLRDYPSLGSFFYRKLKPGVRPVDPAVLVSPADGTVLHFGTIQDRRIEQVKGITYSLDALLGVERPGSPVSVTVASAHNRDMSIVDDREFANVNGIEYSLDQLIGGPSGTDTPTEGGEETGALAVADAGGPPKKFGARIDASVVEPERSMQETLVHDASVALEMGMKPAVEGEKARRRRSTSGTSVKPGNALFFSVIYLAPGDYHRFHSPTAWVVEKRRHFVGVLAPHLRRQNSY
jgi:phosphatidylserine decarboxylase